MDKLIAKKISILFASVIVLVMSSCVPQKKIVMVQEPDSNITYAPLEKITNKYKLQPNDYLYINVASPDPKLSVFFNPQSASGTNNLQSQASFFYYMIDDSMNIDFPVTGKINLYGCNLETAKTRIYNAISQYLSDFTLTCKLASNTFAVLGEVNSQGQKTMSREQITIFDAIAQAGGFTSYAKRSEVKLIRKNEKGEAQTYKIDLTKGEVINSDFYYVYPNDILYVRPMWIKTLGFGETISLGLVTSLISLYLLARSL